jgi:hypothetical protein
MTYLIVLFVGWLKFRSTVASLTQVIDILFISQDISGNDFNLPYHNGRPVQRRSSCSGRQTHAQRFVISARLCNIRIEIEEASTG